MSLYSVTTVLQVLAAALAVLMARRRPDHRPVALFLAGMTIANAIRWGLRGWVIFPAQAVAHGAPLTGLARVAGHIDQALFLAWPTGLVALAVVVFLGRRPWPVILAWVAAVGALVWTHFTIRGTAARPFYLAAELAALLASIGCVLQWGWRRQAVTLPRMSTLFLIAIDCGTLVGPYRGNPFATWDLAQAMYLFLYSVLIVQGGIAWFLSKRSGLR